MAEFIIVLPMLLLIALGSIQWALIYQAKVTVEHATFMAARAGAVTGGDVGEMRDAFAKGILPLYSPDKDAPLALDLGAGLEAWIDSRNWVGVNVGAGATQMLILNPTREAFDDHGEQVGPDTLIRNDRLHLKSMEADGPSGVSVQDANLLKVHVLYGYELKLPFIRDVLAWMGSRSTSDLAKQAMWQARRIPVLSTSTVRMQSDVKLSDNVLSMADVDELLESDSLPYINGHSYEGHRPWDMGPSGGNDGFLGGGIGGIGQPLIGEGGGGIDPGQFDNGDGGGGGDPGGGGVGPDDGGGGGPGGGGGDPGGGGGPGDCDPGDASCDGDDGDDDLGAVDCDSDDGGGGGGDGNSPGGSRFADTSGLNGSGAVAGTSQAMNLPSVMVGNPINVVTGNKYQAEVDMRGAIPFARHYNSQTRHNGRMGNNWRHSFEVSVRPVHGREGVQRMRVTQADGRTMSFTASTGDVGVSIPDAASVKAVYAARMPTDGWILDRGNQGYDWVRQTTQYSQQVLEFNDAGFLNAVTKISDGNEVFSERMQLLYDATGTQLMGVVNADDQRMGLSYYKNGRLRQLTDPAGLETTFEYDGNGNLKSVSQNGSLLKSYHYEDANDPHNLTGVSDASGNRLATYAYDELDRATYSSGADSQSAVSLTYGEVSEVASSGGAKRTRSTTEVTDSAGVKSTYFTEMRDGIPRVTQISGPGCDACSAGDVSYEYNDNHQLTAVNYKSGVSRTNTYDDLGRLVKKEAIDATGQASVLAEYKYSANSSAIESVTRAGASPNTPRTLEVEYTPDGQLAKAIESRFERAADGQFSPLSSVTNFDYADGKLVGIEKIDNGVSKRTTYGYDHQGRLAVRELPSGRRLEVLARDGQGRPTNISAALPMFADETSAEQSVEARNFTLEYDQQGGVASISDGDRTWQPGAPNSGTPARFGELPGASGAQESIDRSVAMLEFNAVLQEVDSFESASRAVESGGVDDPALRNSLSRDECDENAEECAEIANGQRYGELSQCIYDPSTCQSPNISDEWQEVDPSELGLEEDDFISGGFAAGVYQSSETGEYTLVFRGTDNLSDWIDNLGQGAGFTTSQYEMAIELARALQDGLPPGSNITVTGHSLGGGLATAAALELGVPAVVFNAAGLNPQVAADNNLDMSQANNLIDLYHVEGEILTSAQDLGPITMPLPFFPYYTTIDGPSAPGERVSLPPPSDEWLEDNIDYAWYLPNALEESIQLHLMTSVMQSLQEQSEALGCE